MRFEIGTYCNYSVHSMQFLARRTPALTPPRYARDAYLAVESIRIGSKGILHLHTHHGP
jgi:hypothetical protein